MYTQRPKQGINESKIIVSIFFVFRLIMKQIYTFVEKYNLKNYKIK